MCGNRQGIDCIAGRVDSFLGMTIINCPDFYKGDQVILINVDGLRELLEEYFPEYKETLTGERVKAFMDFMEQDVTDWIKENWECFTEKAASDGVKKLMDSVSEE